jgi:chromosome segregation ATPase
MALGEAIETPFRIMDEFDVFLDTHARKLAISTLVHMAKSMEHRQFIFITPQDVSSVKIDEKVRVFTLKPPERNEVAGAPTQRTLEFSQE